MAKVERRLTKEIRQHYKTQYESIKLDVEEYVNKIEILRKSHSDESRLIEQLLEIFARSWDNDKISASLYKYYMEIARIANKNAKGNPKGVLLDSSDDQIFMNPAVAQYFKESAGTRIKAIGETTLKHLRTTLEKCYKNQDSTQKWIDNIKKVIDCDYPRNRGEKIARTEMAWAYNSGLLATYKEIGTRKLRWLAIMDSHTCPICRGYHDEIFNIDDLPDIPAHPLCRCTVVSADDE